VKDRVDLEMVHAGKRCEKVEKWLGPHVKDADLRDDVLLEGVIGIHMYSPERAALEKPGVEQRSCVVLGTRIWESGYTKIINRWVHVESGVNVG
jgi:hypothetical protein